MTSAVRLEIARLVLTQRWAALATLDHGAPHATMVAYVPEPGLASLLLLLSDLAAHTGHLREEPRSALAITTPDSGDGDPQLLPRAGVQGVAQEVPREDPAFDRLAARYVERFPDAAMRFQLSDFRLFRFVPSHVRYIGGFARAVSITGAELAEAAGAL